MTLYEEACSRQWSATQDIDWHRLEPLPPDLERALCQFNTFLTMGEYLATDVLAPWLTVTQADALQFPSVVWFRALADAAVAAEARYRRLGVVELTFGLSVGGEGFRLAFEDFGRVAAATWDGSAPVDCVLVASKADWRELIEHIRARGSADPAHTLNSLVLAGDRFALTGDDQLGIDTFYRFNATLQAFFEEARNVPTRFG